MNLRRISGLILAGLFWISVGVGCISPADLLSAGDQPARLASPTASATPAAPQLFTPTPTPSPIGIAVSTSQSLSTTQPPEDRTPTRIVIPAIKLDAPIEPIGVQLETQSGQSVYVWDAPKYFAAGWLNTSAVVGVAGNTVLDGHHNIYGEVFKDLINLQVGYTLTLYSLGQQRIYRVDQKVILLETGQPLKVRLANAQYIAKTEDERLTLITCWPLNDNSHRLIIVARPISSPSAE